MNLVHIVTRNGFDGNFDKSFLGVSKMIHDELVDNIYWPTIFEVHYAEVN